MSTEETERHGNGAAGKRSFRAPIPVNLQIVKFLLCIVSLSIALEVLWHTQIGPNLYDCTDAGVFEYLIPGEWVHGKIMTVPKVIHNRLMSEPDTIKEGWTVRRLWMLWMACFGGSVALSLALARAHWIPFRVERILLDPPPSPKSPAA
jgi:hypothetical protein